MTYLEPKSVHDGQYEAYRYDNRYRATHIDVFNSGNTPLHETEYVFNAASEVDSTIIDSVQTDYLYDAASQITEESRSGYTCNYTY